MNKATSRTPGGGGTPGGEDVGRHFREAASLLQVFERCQADDEFKSQFLQDPNKVLAEAGIEIPPGVEVKVVENEPKLVHIVLPSPSEDAAETAPIGSLTLHSFEHRHNVGIIF